MSLLADLAAPAAAPRRRRAGRVRVATWNVQNASPARSRSQAAWLAATELDAVALTEVSATHDTLTAALHDHGFATWTPRASGQWSGDYRVVLASRAAAIETPDRLVTVEHQPHRCAAAVLHLEAVKGEDQRPALLLAGLYVPSRGPAARRNVDKRAFQNAVTTWLPQLAAAGADLAVPVLACGDLNIVEPEHVPHHDVFGPWEYDFYTSFAAAGFADAYRLRHPDSVEHSWFGRRSGNGYRFDHLFLDHAHATAVTNCGYDQAPRLQRLSDHALMHAEIALDHPTPIREEHPNGPAPRTG